MRKMYWTLAGATALLIAAACTDRGAPTDAGRGFTPRGSSRDVGGVSGAVFTSTNPAVDDNPDLGTNHDLCQNAKDSNGPANNCNIYFDKKFVWLSGGPGPSSLEDGTYFFAVLVPGGQNNSPNDGGPLNLSDQTNVPVDPASGDVYTNRIFTVSAGVISYAGTHDFVGGMIRLMPYDNTTNSGGEYDMAVCKLGAQTNDGYEGYPANPNQCKYDNFKVDVTKPCDNPAADDCLFHPVAAQVVTDVHLSGATLPHTVIDDVTGAPLGSKVHDKATVTTTDGAAIPGGSKVTFVFYSGNSCAAISGSAIGGPEDHPISGPSAQFYDGGLEQTLSAGEYSYKASFTSGDPHTVQSAQGECEPFKINKASTTTTTDIHDAAHNVITNTTVAVGTTIHDKASVGTAVGAIPITGTVTFAFYPNGTCSGTLFTSETVTIGSGEIASSAKVITVPGSYGYKTKYDGDANYNPSTETGGCEPIVFDPLGKTQGFWGNNNGIAKIEGSVGGYAGHSVDIGRGAVIDTKGEALKVLPSTGNACGKYTTGSLTNPNIFTAALGSATTSKDCLVNSGLNVGTLNTAASQTLALGYNRAYTWAGYPNVTIGGQGCAAFITSALTGLTAGTKMDVLFAAAQALINTSYLTPGGSTQAQLGAMNSLLGCINREA